MPVKLFGRSARPAAAEKKDNCRPLTGELPRVRFELMQIERDTVNGLIRNNHVRFMGNEQILSHHPNNYTGFYEKVIFSDKPDLLKFFYF